MWGVHDHDSSPKPVRAMVIGPAGQPAQPVPATIFQSLSPRMTQTLSSLTALNGSRIGCEPPAFPSLAMQTLAQRLFRRFVRNTRLGRWLRVRGGPYIRS